MTLGSVVLSVACGEPEDDDPPAAPAQTSGVQGGFVGDENGLGVYIPPGALAQPAPITLSVAATGDYPELPQGAIGEVYSFEPQGLTFAAPVTVHLPLPDGEVAGAFRAEPGGAWEPIDGAVQVQGSTASFEAVSFSYFVLSN